MLVSDPRSEDNSCQFLATKLNEINSLYRDDEQVLHLHFLIIHTSILNDLYSSKEEKSAFIKNGLLRFKYIILTSGKGGSESEWDQILKEYSREEYSRVRFIHFANIERFKSSEDEPIKLKSILLDTLSYA